MAYTTINKSTDYFRTKLYTGNGSARSITFDESSNMQPDFSWTKRRSASSDHLLFDSVRGVQEVIKSNSTSAESTLTAGLTAFNTNGYSIGTDGDINNNTSTYASWNWKANGAGSANTDGSISSTVSANATSGFSIVSYTGTGANATVGHGLGSLCKWIIIKRLNGTNNWEIGNTAMGWGKHIYFTTTAQLTNSNRFQDTAPTNSVFYIGDGAGVNASGGNYIAYCFAEKQGFSKFGSYVGNGSTDGTFIYTGFKPAFVMVKRTDSANSWIIMDNKRTTFNPMGEELKAEVSDAGSVATRWDNLSNGFKLRSSGGAVNASGGTYIYMAFAEEPLVGDNPATAR